MKIPVNYDKIDYKERRLVREHYEKIQSGLCYHCEKPLKGDPCNSVKRKPVSRSLYPDSFFKWPVHLHHNHNTGMTIGAVHCYCNAVLWEYHGE